MLDYINVKIIWSTWLAFNKFNWIIFHEQSYTRAIIIGTYWYRYFKSSFFVNFKWKLPINWVKRHINSISLFKLVSCFFFFCLLLWLKLIYPFIEKKKTFNLVFILRVLIKAILSCNIIPANTYANLFYQLDYFYSPIFFLNS